MQDSITEANSHHLQQLLPMMLDLWPEEKEAGLRPICTDILASGRNKIYLYQRNKDFIGFIYLSIRQDYVEGSDSAPVGYVEGIYVKPEYRRQGISAKLLAAGEDWVRSKGCSQMGSDIYADNHASYDFHTASGFKEAGRLIAFIKDLQ